MGNQSVAGGSDSGVNLTVICICEIGTFIMGIRNVAFITNEFLIQKYS